MCRLFTASSWLSAGLQKFFNMVTGYLNTLSWLLVKRTVVERRVQTGAMAASFNSSVKSTALKLCRTTDVRRSQESNSWFYRVSTTLLSLIWKHGSVKPENQMPRTRAARRTGVSPRRGKIKRAKDGKGSASQSKNDFLQGSLEAIRFEPVRFCQRNISVGYR